LFIRQGWRKGAKRGGKIDGSGSFITIYSNLKEFKQIVVRDYLLNLPDQISGWTAQFLG
jgi:hypothetical protein